MEFTQNDWGQCDIINKTKILTKRGSDKVHDIIPTKYQKYPSDTILKHANVLSKSNKLPYVFNSICRQITLTVFKSSYLKRT